MINTDQQIKVTMARFDFRKVHKVMTVVGWLWGSPGHIPTSLELKECVFDLLHQVADSRVGVSISSGGFTAGHEQDEYGTDYLTLAFVLEAKTSEWYQEDPA